MNNTIQQNERTRELLIRHAQTYPSLEIQDIFKYLFHSSFGCEHLVSDESAVLDHIKKEYESVPKTQQPLTEPLNGRYSRVWLSHLSAGLCAQTLARLFCMSARKEENATLSLEQKLAVLRELTEQGMMPFDGAELEKRIDEWRASGYAALHHSDAFRSAYCPTYRVIANEYARFLPLFAAIDKHLACGRTVVAVEGGSASGKTTLADLLAQVYDCNVLHMDDFFLRPEQRTPARLSEVGGNFDRERFYDEIVVPLNKHQTVQYRPFDCQTQSLGERISIEPKRLTVVEGVYSTHPELGRYYDLSAFLHIDPAQQRARIQKRNTPALAERFFGEWIPKENAYFAQTRILERCDVLIK